MIDPLTTVQVDSFGRPGRERLGVRMGQLAAIVDCYTVEPSGLGVPPYLSGYARQAFGALRGAYPDADVLYLTIDDVRWRWNGGRPFVAAPLKAAPSSLSRVTGQLRRPGRARP